MAEQLRISDPKNSVCDSADLASLDFAEWWTDSMGGVNYIHASRFIDETYHRVYCRHSDTPRVGMAGGRPVWLISKAAPAEPAPEERRVGERREFSMKTCAFPDGGMRVPGSDRRKEAR